MDNNRLYVIEVSVKGIRFSPCIAEIPEKPKIHLCISFRNFVNMNVGTDSFNTLSITYPELCRSEVKLNICGSQEFRCKAEDLLMALSAEPLMLYFMTEWDPIPFGISYVPWTLNFLSMVEKSRLDPKQSQAAYSRGDYELFANSSGQLLGEVDAIVRLSTSIADEII